MTREIFQIVHFKDNKVKRFQLQVSDDGNVFLSVHDATVEPNIHSTLRLEESELALIATKTLAYLYHKDFKVIEFKAKSET